MDQVVDRFRRMYPNVVDVQAQYKKNDADGDGGITLEELVNGMTECKEFTKEAAKYAFELADSNTDGKIDISEFVSLMFPAAKEAIANLRKLFRGPNDVAKIAFESSLVIVWRRVGFSYWQQRLQTYQIS